MPRQWPRGASWCGTITRRRTAPLFDEIVKPNQGAPIRTVGK
jgi:hypothetical protein